MAQIDLPTISDLAELKRDLMARLDAAHAGLADVRGVLARLEAAVGGGPPGPVPQPAPAPDPGPPTGRIVRDGGRLILDGRPFRSAGVNWALSVGCRAPADLPDAAEADRVMRELPRGTVVRVWCMPGMQVGRLRMVLAAAEKYGHRVIVTLFQGARYQDPRTGQWRPHCTTQEISYASSLPPSEADWITTVLGPIRDSPALFAVDGANEANERHPNIKPWYTAVFAAIRRAAPNVLIASGGGNQLGDRGPGEIVDLFRGTGVDIITAHFYPGGDLTRPDGRARPWVDAAQALGVVAAVGEMGMEIGAGGDRGSVAANAALLPRMYDMYFDMGFQVVAFWELRRNGSATAHAQVDLQRAEGGNALWDEVVKAARKHGASR